MGEDSNAKRRRVSSETWEPKGTSNAELVAEYKKYKQLCDENQRRMELIKNRLAQIEQDERANEQQPSTPERACTDETADESTKSNAKGNEVNDSSTHLLYIHRGRSGKIPIPTNGIIFLHELEDGLQSLPKDVKVNEESDADRAKTKYELDYHGKGSCWVPRGSVAIAKNKLSPMKESQQQMGKFIKLFEGDYCGFKQDIRQYFTAASITGYGCSDEAAILMMTATLKCVIKVMLSPEEITPSKLKLENITNLQIAKAPPSRATLASDEHELAASCIMVTRQEIISDFARFLGWISDHGHRHWQEHFVKLASWAGIDPETLKKTIKTVCVDVDSCNHTTEGCAESLKNSFEPLIGDNDNAELNFGTGDTGGGGAIGKLHKQMIKIGAVASDCKEANCILHGFSKGYQQACEDVIGTQGLFHDSPYQLLFLFADIMQRSSKRFGREQHDEMWAKTVNKVLNCKESQTKLWRFIHKHLNDS